jgi:ubiquinone biosynthesis protein UbiJ
VSATTAAPPLPAATALAALEAAINGLLSLDPEGAAGLTSLEGRVLAFEFMGFGNRLYFIPGQGRLQVFGAYDAEPDCLLRGTPVALATLGMAHAKEDALFNGQVEIEGDTALAHRFGNLLANLDIDWEEQLARLTGDPFAHALGSRVRSVSRWGQGSLATLGQDFTEYLQEEGRLLPSRYELESFLTEVDRLRDDGERLAARVNRLRRHLQRDHE